MKRQRFFVLSSVVFVLVLVIGGLIWKRNQTDQNRPLVIGANLTLTGKFSYFGQQVRDGLILAVESSKQIGHQRDIELVIEDNQHDAKLALAAHRKLVDQDKAAALVSLYSPMGKVLREEALRDGIPLVTTYTTAKDIPNAFTFRDFPPLDQQVPPLARYLANERNTRKAATIVFQADFGLEAQDIFDKVFREAGGELTSEQAVPLGVSEDAIRTTVLSTLSSKPDTVLLILSAQTLASTVRSLRESGFKGIIAGIVMFDSPEVWSLIGDADEGIVFTGIPIQIEADPALKDFFDRFRERFSSEPGYMAVYGYSIGQYLIEEARSADGDPQQIRDGLQTLDMKTIRGTLIGTKNNTIESSVAIFQRSKGKNEIVKHVALEALAP